MSVLGQALNFIIQSNPIQYIDNAVNKQLSICQLSRQFTIIIPLDHIFLQIPQFSNGVDLQLIVKSEPRQEINFYHQK